MAKEDSRGENNKKAEAGVATMTLIYMYFLVVLS